MTAVPDTPPKPQGAGTSYLPAPCLPNVGLGLSLEGQRFGEGKSHHLSRSIKTEWRFLSS